MKRLSKHFTASQIDDFKICEMIFLSTSTGVLFMKKKIKKLVHSSDPNIDFDWITLTENQDKFLDVFNNFMDQVGNPIFDHFMQRISETKEYINISKAELEDLYKNEEAIWSGCATQTFLDRFYGRYKKK